MKNVIIGIFVIAAITIGISLILFLKPSVGDMKKTLRVRFSNISGIGIGTRVTFAGRPVGEVKQITEVPNAREQPVDTLKRVYFYQLILKVDSSVEVYNTDEISTQTSGLMGEKTVAIIPKAPPKGFVAKPVTNQVIYAESVDPLEQALHEITSVAKKAGTMIDDLNQWFNENSEDLTKTVTYLCGSIVELDTILHSVNQEKIVGKVTNLLDLVHDDLRLIRNMLEEAEDNQMMAKLNVILENFADVSKVMNVDGKQILSNLNVTTTELADGSGTIGKLLKSDDLYLRFTSIMSKVDTLMNDINHYGILFQYDKSWQRQRTKRANMLNALATPRQFRSFFEEEIDTITTALARISILLQRAESEEERTKIMNSSGFKKDFAKLLRNVDDLYDSLKLYNEQLVEIMNREECGVCP